MKLKQLSFSLESEASGLDSKGQIKRRNKNVSWPRRLYPYNSTPKQRC